MKSNRVAVAMSGGVDSTLAAALLLEAGYELGAFTLRLFEEEEVAAAEAAACLGIPHRVIDARPEFERQVIADFCREYEQGRTPNPCVVCNAAIKFGRLLTAVRAEGWPVLATGHYARVEYDPERRRWCLLRGVDRRKDQSYFLYRLGQEQLAAACFPLGAMSKEQVREMAEERSLPVARRPESQEICFLGGEDYRQFLARRRCAPPVPGPFLDSRGRVLGCHRGLPYYTVGQRRGLGIAVGRPLYVLALDPERNAVVLGEAEELLAPGLIAGDNRFILLEQLQTAIAVEVRIRSTAAPVAAQLNPRPGGEVAVSFEQPQRAVAPGQAVVYYQGERVLGGGTILRTWPGGD